MEKKEYYKCDTSYYRDYYKNKYHNDPIYKEKKKKYELDRLNKKYIKKTIICQACKVRKLMAYMKEIDYEFDINDFFCTECNPINCPGQQVKPRPNKNKSNQTDSTLLI